MSSPGGQPQSLLVVDLRPEHAERMISHIRDCGLAVRATRMDNLDQALDLIEKSPPDAVLLAAEGPPGWSFETALMGMAKFGVHPVVVAGAVDSVMLTKALTMGASCVIPEGSIQALGLVLRRTLEASGRLRELQQARASQQETAIREEALLDLSRDPVAYIHEGMHIKANKAYMDLFHIADADDVEGLTFLDLVHPADADRVKDILKQASRDDLSGKSFEFGLVPEGVDPVQAHVEISRANYDGEPCLQVTLRMGVPAHGSALIGQPSLASASLAASEVLAVNASAWWMYVKKMQEENSAAFMAVARPNSLVRVPMEHAHEYDQILWSRAISALRKEFGSRFSDQCFVQLGASTFGFALTAPDTEAARSDAHKFKKIMDVLDLDIQGHMVRTIFEVSAVALGAAMGWGDFPEAKASVNKGFSSLDAGFSWFDPSHEGREELARQRAVFKAIVAACSHRKGLCLQYRPMMPLNAQPRALFETVQWLDLGDLGLLGGAELMHGLMEADCMGEFDAWLVSVVAQSVSRLSGKDACVLVPMSASSLKSPLKIIEAARPAAGRLAMQWPANHLSSWPEQATEARQMLQSDDLGLAISELGNDTSYQDLLRRLEPEWACLDASWSDTDRLREKQTQQELTDLVSIAKLANSLVVARAVSNSSTMSALFSADIDYAHGDFLSFPVDEMGEDQ